MKKCIPSPWPRPLTSDLRPLISAAHILAHSTDARPNTVHHHYPRYMTQFNWWYTSRDLLVVAMILLVLAWCFGLLTWQVWLFAILAVNANEFHKWEHRTRQENGWLISFLQDIRILQTVRHHARHHTDPKNSHYCTTTNLMNPVLDGIHFWDSLEWLLARTIGLKRREDTSVRGHGPGPAWLEEYRRPPQGASAPARVAEHAPAVENLRLKNSSPD